MRRTIRWSLIAACLLALALAFGAAACDDDDEGGGEEATPTAGAEPTEPSAEAGVLEVTGLDYTYSSPSSIAGGVTTIHFTNGSEAEDHQAQLFRLNEGTTFEDFNATLLTAASEADVLPLGTLVGGLGVGAGGTAEAVLDLQEGTHVMLCFIPSPADGTPHVAKGMITTLEVTAPAAEQPEPPVADVSVGLADFAFDVPETLPAGATTFEVTNNGPQPHEMALIQAAQGATYQDVLDIILAEPDPEAPPPSGPPPFTFVGQMAVLGNGESGFTTIDLSAGTYALLCFVTDPDSGAPHAALGMAQELTVE